jgi:hypothetical protein
MDDIECFRHLALEPWDGAGYLVVARSLPQTPYTLLNISFFGHVPYALKAAHVRPSGTLRIRASFPRGKMPPLI